MFWPREKERMAGWHSSVITTNDMCKDIYRFGFEGKKLGKHGGI
jgi:hypothetical protein